MQILRLVLWTILALVLSIGSILITVAWGVIYGIPATIALWAAAGGIYLSGRAVRRFIAAKV